jgi:hypothetical protein
MKPLRNILIVLALATLGRADSFTLVTDRTHTVSFEISTYVVDAECPGTVSNCAALAQAARNKFPADQAGRDVVTTLRIFPQTLPTGAVITSAILHTYGPFPSGFDFNSDASDSMIVFYKPLASDAAPADFGGPDSKGAAIGFLMVNGVKYFCSEAAAECDYDLLALGLGDALRGGAPLEFDDVTSLYQRGADYNIGTDSISVFKASAQVGDTVEERLTLQYTAPVPEPSTILLLATGVPVLLRGITKLRK